VTIKAVKLPVRGVVKMTKTPTPRTRMAAPTVAKTSTMMRPRSAAMAMAPIWRFSLLAGAEMRSVEVERPSSADASWCGSAEILVVVEVMAAVIRLI
jgi:hypothetical protein